ncbi:MAG: hypothetical protein ACYCZR_10745 [Burkholderiales bacterium]
MGEPLLLEESPCSGAGFELGNAGWGRRDVFLKIRLSRNLTIAILASLLLHALVLFVTFRHPPIAIKHANTQPLAVELVPLKKTRKSVVAPQPRTARKIIAVRRPSREAAAIPEQRESNSAPVPPHMSFLDYVNASRARRDADVNEYPVQPQAMGPFPDSGKHKEGTSGVFQILRMSGESAEFSFLGWHSEYANSHREVFDVDAGADGDVRHAIVRKMIEIIRRYYDGDFNWKSDRLGGEVVLSARLKDDAELQAFMMKEFFDQAH